MPNPGLACQKCHTHYCNNHRKVNGTNGFVPANYVKEIEPKLVSVEVKKPVTVRYETFVAL